ncbi:Uma2 family endonuclease [Streptomyces sp. NPDC085937]|uniref:Uma2 family endonuclease n=1 Tax=Streptomyces sp. NPDC085937 TaxID=3365742 RepID=UPI0037D00E5F
MAERGSSQLSVDMFERIAEFAERKGRALPDAVLAPVAHFAGQGDWADTEGVPMTVEVTSFDSDTHDRDRVEKPQAYAESGIPVYLLVDRDRRSVLVHSDPDPVVGHRNVQKRRLGQRVVLPDPVGVEFDTEEPKQYMD